MTAQYLYGDTKPITAPFDPAQSGGSGNNTAPFPVEIGDLSWIDTADTPTALATAPGYAVKSAVSFDWASAISTPSAPTVADGGTAVGTPLTNAATHVKISYQFPWGEGPLSNAGSATPTANAFLKVSGTPLVPPSPALWTNVYVETSAGSGTYKLYGTTQSGSTILVQSYGAGQSPAASPVTASALVVTQYNFAQAFAGVSGQRYDGSNAQAYGIKDGNLRIDSAGVYQFDTASASYNEGQYVGPDENSTPNGLLPQQVAAVAHPTLAIGQVVAATSSSTTVKVRLLNPANQVPAVAG